MAETLWASLLQLKDAVGPPPCSLVVNTCDTRGSLLVTSLHLCESFLLSVMCKVDFGEYSIRWRKEGTASQKYLIIIQWNNFEHFCLLE